MLRILADQNIPFAAEAFGALGEVRLVPAAAITRDAVRHADVLLVRSVTPVDDALVAGSPLRFVGTASTGTDHLDIPALHARGIAVHHAPGSNADAVVEYVLAALLHLAVTRNEPLRGRTIGIIGCGNIGGRLAQRLEPLGMRVLRNDPPLAERAAAQGESHPYVPLERVLAEADVVSLHVPLTRTGPHPTFHLLDAPQLAALRHDAWLINAARGAALSNAALRQRLAHRALAATVLDVWEREPEPDLELLRHVDLATPHIAGHSFDGKVNGTLMLHAALVRELNLHSDWNPESVLAPTAGDRTQLEAPDPSLGEVAWLDALVRQLYDIARDDRRTRTGLQVGPGELAAAFHRLRTTYPRRRTFARFQIAAADVPKPLQQVVRAALGVRLS